MRFSAVSFALLLLSADALAFPTGTIWLPNDQTENQRVWRFDNQVYFPVDNRAVVPAQAPSLDLGVTYCLIKNEYVAAEAGTDWWEPVPQDNLRAPHIHGKFTLLEREYFPSLVFGAYDVGFETNSTNYNVVYFGVAKTLPGKQRLFFAYFGGNPRTLQDDKGNSANQGLMLSFVQPLAFISEKFWFLLDLQTSMSPLGAISLGGLVNVLPSFDLIFGYNNYNNQTLSRDTATAQFEVRI